MKEKGGGLSAEGKKAQPVNFRCISVLFKHNSVPAFTYRACIENGEWMADVESQRYLRRGSRGLRECGRDPDLGVSMRGGDAGLQEEKVAVWEVDGSPSRRK